jgi:hypothetical protein
MHSHVPGDDVMYLPGVFLPHNIFGAWLRIPKRERKQRPKDVGPQRRISLRNSILSSSPVSSGGKWAAP